LYDIETGEKFVSRDVIFHEETYPFASQANPENDFSNLKDDLGWMFDNHMDEEHHRPACLPNGTLNLGHTTRPDTASLAPMLDGLSRPSLVLPDNTVGSVEPCSGQQPKSGAVGAEEVIGPSIDGPHSTAHQTQSNPGASADRGSNLYNPTGPVVPSTVENGK